MAALLVVIFPLWVSARSWCDPVSAEAGDGDDDPRPSEGGQAEGEHRDHHGLHRCSEDWGAACFPHGEMSQISGLSPCRVGGTSGSCDDRQQYQADREDAPETAGSHAHLQQRP